MTYVMGSQKYNSLHMVGCPLTVLCMAGGEQTLVSVSTIGTFPNLPDENLANVVRRELQQWFGSSAEAWELLRVYRIPFAQPNQV
jgi:hypothetical protein